MTATREVSYREAIRDGLAEEMERDGTVVVIGEDVEPGPGQESVWDYPRPPALEDSPKLIQVVFNGVTLAESRRAKRLTRKPVEEEAIKKRRGRGGLIQRY